jgi:hypothetical protein
MDLKPDEDSIRAGSPAERFESSAISGTADGPTEAEIAQFLAAREKDPSIEWKMVMNFWGRVLDERNRPIENASIHFTWNDLSADGTSHHNAFSDGSGLFELLGRRGKRLYVTVEKIGYYQFPESSRTDLEYGMPWERFHPDPENPVIFRLKKAGVWEPLDFRGGLIKLRDERSRLILNFDDVFNRKEGPLEIFIWRDPKREKGRPFDWSLSVRVPSGGVAPCEGDFPGPAPEDGYQPEDGRIDLRWLPQRAGKHATSSLEVKCWVNPSRSRNLEDNPAWELKQSSRQYLRTGPPNQSGPD